MSSKQESITSLWDQSSTTVKEYLSTPICPDNYIKIEPIGSERTLEIIQAIIEQSEKEKSILIVTNRIQDAIDLALLINTLANRDLASLHLPHHRQAIDSNAPLTITTLYQLNLDEEIWPLLSSRYSHLFFDPINQDSPLLNTPKLLKRYSSALLASDIVITPINTINIIDLLASSADKKRDKQEINIAILQGNFKRQYIRDSVRSEELTSVVVILKHHQEARQLQSYLYRGRIRAKTIHKRTSDKIREQIIREFNEQKINVLIVVEECAQSLANRLSQVDKLYLYDLPTLYIELKEFLELTATYFSPKEQQSLATENQRVWVESLKEECDSDLCTIILKSVEAPKNRRNQQRNNRKTSGSRTSNNRNRNSDRKSTQRKRNTSRNRKNDRTNREEIEAPKRADNEGIPEISQQDIVNENRLPFEANSFEANIAKINRQRVRNVFSNQRQNHQLEDHTFRQEGNGPNTTTPQRGNRRSRRNNNRNKNGNQ